MAYNLESLIHILDHNILHPHPLQPWILDPHRKPQIQSLLDKARFLNELFEKVPPTARERVWSLETVIRDAAYEAEDIIESHLVDRLLSRVKGQKLMISPPNLQQVIDKFDLANQELIKMIDSEAQIRQTTTSSQVVLPRNDQNPNNIFEGLSNDLMQLKDWLTSDQSKLEIMPIVGMGGIGKTTLAQKLYDDELVVSHFDIRSWITISQEYEPREMLISLLQCVMGNVPDKLVKEDNHKLVLHLYKALCGRRFLIVLDDMWASEAWDCIKMCFPDNKNQSRIVVTTREVSVANYVGSQNLHHQMQFLSVVESWNLLRRKVFATESCPPELKRVGKKIAEGCAGLPLAVHVVGGLLAERDKTPGSWEHLANGLGAAVANKDELVSNVLSLSYNHLPNHLKPIFLYMGAFPEDSEIHSSKFIRRCVAEGFVRPISDKSLEEAVRLYLKALVDRNLLLVYQQEINGKVKSYRMHDLLRELCIKKAQEEKFLYLTNPLRRQLPPDEMIHLRRLNVHKVHQIEQFFESTDSTKVLRSFIFTGRLSFFCLLVMKRLYRFGIPRLHLLRVSHVLNTNMTWASEQLPKLVNLRYLACRIPQDLSWSLANLCNLQTLILYIPLNCVFTKVYEISNLPCLRHVKFKGKYPLFDLPHGEDVRVQRDLQTLSSVVIDSSIPKVLNAIPNLKKLRIFVCESFPISCGLDLTCLATLETLKYSSLESSSFLTSLIAFPPSLTKLTLRKCIILSECLETIGALPNLEILKLQESTFENPTWEPTEEGFGNLRLLLLEGLNLVNWIANETYYPRLEHLVIRDCSQLEKIPIEFGDICTLEMIEVDGCCSSLLASAWKIHYEQLEMENNLLQVRINALRLSC